MRRRGFLKGSLATVGGVLLSGGAIMTTTGVAAAATGAQYPVNRAPLRPAAFLRLPPGSVRPAGWLATQLDYQLTGLNGRYPDLSHFLVLDNTGWVHPGLVGWEEVPYWLRGYGDLGYVTGDSGVLSRTEQW